MTANSPSVSNGCVDSVNDARIAYSGELRVDIFVEHHVDEHNKEDEGIRPRSICNELLHHHCFSPPLPYAIEELPDCQGEKQCLKRERDDPDEPCECLTCRA